MTGGAGEFKLSFIGGLALPLAWVIAPSKWELSIFFGASLTLGEVGGGAGLCSTGLGVLF